MKAWTTHLLCANTVDLWLVRPQKHHVIKRDFRIKNNRQWRKLTVHALYLQQKLKCIMIT